MAKLSTEVIICGDSELTSFDAEMADEYLALIYAASAGSVSQIRDEQGIWLKTRNACQTDSQCIASVYRERLQRFGEWRGQLGIAVNGMGSATADASAPSRTPHNLALSGNDRWVVVASRQDLYEAIGIAKTYAAQRPRAIKARNGWFVVFLGPYATSDIASFQHDYGGPPLPQDALLTRGTDYGETVWQPSSEAPALPAAPSPRLAPTPPTSSQPTVVETPAAGVGATITVERGPDKNGQEVTFISIEGELALGDEKRFADVAIRATDAIVALSIVPEGMSLQELRLVKPSG
jgi:hypothetical protein